MRRSARFGLWLGVGDPQGWGGAVLNVLCVLCPGAQSFLSVPSLGHPQANGGPAGLHSRPALQGLRCFVGEKLPGLGPFFWATGLGTARLPGNAEAAWLPWGLCVPGRCSQPGPESGSTLPLLTRSSSPASLCRGSDGEPLAPEPPRVTGSQQHPCDWPRNSDGPEPRGLARSPPP